MYLLLCVHGKTMEKGFPSRSVRIHRKKGREPWENLICSVCARIQTLNGMKYTENAIFAYILSILNSLTILHLKAPFLFFFGLLLGYHIWSVYRFLHIFHTHVEYLILFQLMNCERCLSFEFLQIFQEEMSLFFCNQCIKHRHVFHVQVSIPNTVIVISACQGLSECFIYS